MTLCIPKIVITRNDIHGIEGQLMNQINPFIHISPHWMKESAIKHTFNEKPLHANECRRYSRWRGYQITSLKPPKDVTRGHSSHTWMPPTARREKPYIYTMSNPNKRYSHSFSAHTKIKALAIITALSLFDFAIRGSMVGTTLVTTRAKLSFCSCVGPLTSRVAFYLNDQFNWRFWHHTHTYTHT